jgi:hypothetical protein
LEDIVKFRHTVLAMCLLLLSAAYSRPASALITTDQFGYDFTFTDNGELNFIYLDIYTDRNFPAPQAIVNITGGASLPAIGLFGSVTGPEGGPAENVVYFSPTLGFYFNSISFAVGADYIEISDPPSIDTISIYPSLTDYQNGIDPLPNFPLTGTLDPTPLPDSLPLFAGGLVVMAYLACRKRSKMVTV